MARAREREKEKERKKGKDIYSIQYSLDKFSYKSIT